MKAYECTWYTHFMGIASAAVSLAYCSAAALQSDGLDDRDAVLTLTHERPTHERLSDVSRGYASDGKEVA